MVKDRFRRRIGRVNYWPTHIKVRRDGSIEIGEWGPVPGQRPERPETEPQLL